MISTFSDTAIYLGLSLATYASFGVGGHICGK